MAIHPTSVTASTDLAATRGFGSDNCSGVHPAVLRAIGAANTGHVPSYGADPLSLQAIEALQQTFGDGSQAHLLWGGTGANITALQALLRPHQAVLCSAQAHLSTDECGAPERFTGSKLIPLPTEHGLLQREQLAAAVAGPSRGEHHVVPAVVTLTNSSELGTVYTPQQLAGICDWAHDAGLAVHLDGARLANAAASLGCSLAEVSTAAGVDAVSFGGTKNGLLGAEAAVFAGTPAGVRAATDYRFIRKQAAQLASKMRFLSAQFLALLDGELWRDSALAANHAAQQLAHSLQELPGVSLAHPVQANGVFAAMPESLQQLLEAEFGCHIWDPATGVMRLVCSFDTTDDDVAALINRARQVL